MVKRGWFNESWRHALARKGVSTGGSPVGFYAEKKVISEERQLRKLQAKRLIGKEVQKQALEARSGSVLIEAVKAGDFSQVRGAKLSELEGKVFEPGVGWRSPKGAEDEARALTSDDVVALREAIGSSFIARVSAGEQVDNDLVNQMNPQVKKQIVDLQKSLRPRSAVELFAKEKGLEALEATEEGIGKGIGKVAKKIGRSGAEVRRDTLKEASEERELRRLEDASEAGFSLFPQKDSDAPFIDESYGGRFTNPFLQGPSDVPAVGGGVGDEGRLAAFDVFNTLGAEQSKGAAFGSVVQKEVDALFGAKNELGHVDTGAFAKGKTSFEKGDYEGVLSALSKMQEQRKQQAQRRNVVFQTRQLVDSPQNRQDQLRAEPGIGTFMFSGGVRIADQTEKIADVHAAVQKGYEEAAVREQVLRQMAMQLRQKPVVPEAKSPRVVDVVKESKKDIISGSSEILGDW